MAILRFATCIALLSAFLACSAQSNAITAACDTHDDCPETDYCGCEASSFHADSLTKRCLPRAIVGQPCGGFTVCPNRCQAGLSCQKLASSPFAPELPDRPGVCCPVLDCSCSKNEQAVVDDFGCQTCQCEPQPCNGLDNVVHEQADTPQLGRRYNPVVRCNDRADCDSGSCDVKHGVCCQATEEESQPMIHSDSVLRQRRDESVDDAFARTTFAPDAELDQDAVTTTASDDEEDFDINTDATFAYDEEAGDSMSSSSSSTVVPDIGTPPMEEDVLIETTDFEADADADDYATDDDAEAMTSTAAPSTDDYDGEEEDWQTTPTVPMDDEEATSTQPDDSAEPLFKTGGWKSITVNERVVAAVQCALDQHNAELADDNMESVLSLVTVLQAQAQVVAGLKYRTRLHVAHGTDGLLKETTMEVYVPPGGDGCQVNHMSPMKTVAKTSTTTRAVDADDENVQLAVALAQQHLLNQLPEDWTVDVAEVTFPFLIMQDDQAVQVRCQLETTYTQHCAKTDPACRAIQDSGVWIVVTNLADRSIDSMTLMSGKSPELVVATSNLPDESHLGDDLRHSSKTLIYYPSFWLAFVLIVLALVGAVITCQRRREQAQLDSYTPMQFSNPSFGLETPTTPSP